MRVTTTVQVRRAERIADSARSLQGDLLEHDVTQLQVADATGRADTVIQRVCDPNRLETLSVVDVRMLVEAGGELEQVALDAVRWQLGDGYALTRELEHGDVHDDLQHLGEFMARAGSLVAHMTQALRNGHLSPKECAAGRKHIASTVELLHALDQRLASAEEQRGDTVRRAELKPIVSTRGES